MGEGSGGSGCTQYPGTHNYQLLKNPPKKSPYKGHRDDSFYFGGVLKQIADKPQASKCGPEASLRCRRCASTWSSRSAILHDAEGKDRV